MVPRTGLVIDKQDVRFEGIDFVYNHPPQASALVAAMVHVRRGQAEFRGCTFRCAGPAPSSPAAVRWTHPVDVDESLLSLPSGRLRLRDCVLRNVASGVDCHTAGALVLELDNTLLIGAGPLLRLDHCPKPDEPLRIDLRRSTLRGAAGLLRCPCPGDADQSGRVSIQTDRCVLVPDAGSPLLLLAGPGSPERLLAQIQWAGQGSLVSPETIIAAWRQGDGPRQALDDSMISIDGIVRGKVGFAGQSESAPAASRTIRWQAPLRSSDPPGIDAATLPGRGVMTDSPGSPLK